MKRAGLEREGRLGAARGGNLQLGRPGTLKRPQALTSQVAEATWSHLRATCTSVSDAHLSFSMAGTIQGTRALMVLSLVLAFLAMIASTVGMKCTRCGGDDKVKKARIAMTGGIIFIVGGE